MRRIVVLGWILFIASFLFPQSLLATSYTVDIYATVPGCGDSLIQSGETCDGSNLGGATCESVGFDEGSLSCSSVCTLITSSCAFVVDTGTGGTRVTSGGRNNSELVITETNVVVAGVALPGMSVSLLKDGQRIATVPAKDDGTFQITVSGLATGLYRMQVIGTVGFSTSARSDVFVVRVIKNSTTKLSGITLPPTITVSSDATTHTVSGYTFPGSAVRLVVDGVETSIAVADETGRYQFVIPKQVQLRTQVVVVSAVHNGIDVSAATTIEPAISAVPPKVGCQGITDINSDCQVDVIDFFVMRWRFLTDIVSDRFDFNNDGAVTIVDFSIMAYYWTG